MVMPAEYKWIPAATPAEYRRRYWQAAEEPPHTRVTASANRQQALIEPIETHVVPNPNVPEVERRAEQLRAIGEKEADKQRAAVNPIALNMLDEDSDSSASFNEWLDGLPIPEGSSILNPPAPDEDSNDYVSGEYYSEEALELR
jgi:hypothetical protein